MKKLFLLLLSFFIFFSNIDNLLAYSGDYIFRNETTGELNKNISGVVSGLGLYTDASLNNYKLSKDGTKVIYYTHPYVKTRLLSGTGAGDTVITFSTHIPWFDFSDDGQYIYYTSSIDKMIYKKSAFDSSTGILNNSIPSLNLSVNGDNIAYLDGRGGYSQQLIIKSTTNTGVGLETGISTFSLNFSPNGDKVIITSIGNAYYVGTYDIALNSLTILSNVAGYNPIISPDNLSFFYNDGTNLYTSLISSFSGSLYLSDVKYLQFLPGFNLLGCYQINTGKTWSGSQIGDFFKSETLSNYSIMTGGINYNSLLLQNLTNSGLYSITFKTIDNEPVNYYLSGALCTDLTCVKNSLFSNDDESYIQILNPNALDSNINSEFYFNTDSNNIEGFALNSNENFNYALYGRQEGQSEFSTYLGSFTTYDYDVNGGTSFNVTSSGVFYSDFKVIIPYKFLGFSRYIYGVTVTYGGSYIDSFSEVCEYDDGVYTLDGVVTSTGVINEIQGSGALNITNSELTSWCNDSTFSSLINPFCWGVYLSDKLKTSVDNLLPQYFKDLFGFFNFSIPEKDYTFNIILPLGDNLTNREYSLVINENWTGALLHSSYIDNTADYVESKFLKFTLIIFLLIVYFGLVGLFPFMIFFIGKFFYTKLINDLSFALSLEKGGVGNYNIFTFVFWVPIILLIILLLNYVVGPFVTYLLDIFVSFKIILGSLLDFVFSLFTFAPYNSFILMVNYIYNIGFVTLYFLGVVYIIMSVFGRLN